MLGKHSTSCAMFSALQLVVCFSKSKVRCQQCVFFFILVLLFRVGIRGPLSASREPALEAQATVIGSCLSLHLLSF